MTYEDCLDHLFSGTITFTGPVYGLPAASIGAPITGGTPGDVLIIDGSGNLSQDTLANLLDGLGGLTGTF